MCPTHMGHLSSNEASFPSGTDVDCPDSDVARHVIVVTVWDRERVDGEAHRHVERAQVMPPAGRDHEQLARGDDLVAQERLGRTQHGIRYSGASRRSSAIWSLGSQLIPKASLSQPRYTGLVAIASHHMRAQNAPGCSDQSCHARLMAAISWRCERPRATA